MISRARNRRGEGGSGSDIRVTRLENGLTVVTERMKDVRSVSFGVFLRNGSRLERASHNGLTHFIEHALFKGTNRRSALEIAAESDSLGGNLDAFTGREIVGFYDKVLDDHLPRAFDLVADLVTNPAFDASELRKERNVVLEEIKMVEDTPDDVVFDIFCESLYPDHPLGRPILGTPRTLAAFRPGVVRAYYDRIYRPENMVISAAGNLSHTSFLDLAWKYFGGLRPGGGDLESPRPEAAYNLLIRNKPDLEQAHLVIGSKCPPAASEDRHGVSLLGVILGGGMSSRLFQSVREDRGLVYNIFASASPFRDCGYLSIYAAVSAGQIPRTIGAVMAELRRLKREHVGAEEMRRNKDQLKASLVLNLESTSSRMSSLASQEITFGRHIAPEELIDAIERVGAGDIRRLANELFDPEEMAVTVYGRLRGLKLDRSVLEC